MGLTVKRSGRVCPPNVLTLGAFVLLLSAVAMTANAEVSIRHMLPAPESTISETGGFRSDSLAYLPNGDLLLSNGNGYMIFVVEDGEYRQLIDRYETELYNNIPKEEWWIASVRLYHSTVEGEYLHEIHAPGKAPPERYRIYLDEEGVAQADLIDPSYFDEHFGGALSYDPELAGGLRIDEAHMEDDPRGSNVRAVDAQGDTVFNPQNHYDIPAIIAGEGRIATSPHGTEFALFVRFREPGERGYINRLMVVRIAEPVREEEGLSTHPEKYSSSVRAGPRVNRCPRVK